MTGVLTRIRNNQVYNSDINASTKIVPGSITGALFPSNLTYSGNLTVGNLTINGNTTVLDTVNIVSSDPVITLNRNFSGVNTNDVGFILGRGNQTNTALVWNESNKEFAFLYTSATTNTSYYGTIPNSGYANIHAYGGLFNNITVTGATITSASLSNFSSGNIIITGGYINNTSIGSITPNSIVATSVTTTNGGQVDGYITGPIGANTPNSVIATSVTTTSGGQVTGYLTGAIGANTPNSVVATSLTTTNGGQITGYITGPIGANSANTGVFTTLTATSGYQGAATGPINGTLGATTPNSVVATSVTTTSGGQVTGYITGPIGANTANTGMFTSVTTTSGGQVIGYLTGPIGANTPNSVVATSVTTTSGGQVTGYITGAIGANTANSASFTSVSTSANVTTSAQFVSIHDGNANTNSGQIVLNGATINRIDFPTGVSGLGDPDATVRSAGTKIVLWPLVDGSGVDYAIGLTSGVLWNSVHDEARSFKWFANTTPVATLTGTGNLTVTNQIIGYHNGAIGANTPNSVIATSVTTTSGGQLTGYHTGAIGANTANTAAFTTLTSSGLTTFTNTTQATSHSSAGVVLNGGLGIEKDTWIHGNLTVDGNLLVQGSRIIIGADTLSILDPIIDLHTYANLAALTFDDGSDIGFKFHYFDTVDSAAFLGRANDTGYLEWYANGTDVANVFTGTTYGTIKAGEIQLANTTASTSTTSGVLRLDGGAGIKGNLFVGGGINGVIGNTTAASGRFTSLTTTSGGQVIGYLTGPIGANTPNSVVATSVTTTSGGQVTGYITGAIGANTANSGVFTSVTTTSGGQVTGYLTGAIGANTPNSVVATSITTTSGGQVTGYLTGAIGANTPNSVVATSVTTTSGGQITGYITGAIGANTANSGVFTTLTATSGYQGAANGSLNGTLGATTPNSVVATSVTTTSGGQVTGYITGPIGANTANSGVFTSVTTTNGGQITGYLTGAIGANIANTGAFTTLTTTSTITSNGNIVANSSTASTDTTTGSIVVVGGTGVSGSLNVGGGVNLQGNGYLTTNQTTATVFNTIATTVNFAGDATSISIGASTGNTTINNGLVSSSNAWINSGGTAANLVVHGNIAAGYSNLLTTNGSGGRVGIKYAPGSIPQNASFAINSSDSMLIPSGSSGSRPSSGTEVEGMIRFNTSTKFLEFWDGTKWATSDAAFTTVTTDSFTGDGTTTVFTLSQSTTTAGTMVMINGVVQIPITSYSVSGYTLTFTEAPLTTDIIDARTILTTTDNSNISGNLTVTGGIRKNARLISTTATLTTADASGFIEFSGASPYTVTLPDPSLANSSGIGYRFWQNTAQNITLSTPVGSFYGPSGSSANTKVLAQATTQYWDVWSDGYNWIVFAIKIA